jgi:hypothetical protein
VKDYPNARAIVLAGTEDKARGAIAWTIVQFRSRTAAVTFRHGARATNATLGADGLDTVMQTFRFDP